MKLTRFEDIEAWKEARLLTKYVYQATNNKNFKKDLRLSGQIKDALEDEMAKLRLLVVPYVSDEEQQEIEKTYKAPSKQVGKALLLQE